MLKPLPLHLGYGFTTEEPLKEEVAEPYEYKKEGIHHNYYYRDEYFLPLPLEVFRKPGRADLFSPNLNKELHVGHLRNLVLASALNSLPHLYTLSGYTLFGTTLGELPNQRAKIKELMSRFGIYIEDWTFVDDKDFAPSVSLTPGIGEFEGCQMFGDVVMVRSNGEPTYSYYELGFAEAREISYYLTGNEQVEHFRSLGLNEKHLPMGLVVGPDGKKLSSRNGEALLAQDLISQIEQSLRGDNKAEVATAVIAMNFLLTARTTNVRFEPGSWVNPKNKGMYSIYNFARGKKALGGFFPWPNLSDRNVHPDFRGLPPRDWGIPPNFKKSWALASYAPYYLARSVETLDPCHVAQHLHTLAQEVASIYENHLIRWGSTEAAVTMDHLTSTMYYLFRRIGITPPITTV